MQQQKKIKISAVVGTRPEAIKMAPLLQGLSAVPSIETHLISTGQHHSQLEQVFSFFELTPDVDLKLMKKNQSLNDIAYKAIKGMDRLLEQADPDLLLVQGDTTTAFAGALAAFNRQTPVGHVEAGLRSGDLMNPYPEEANRKLISAIATLNFAPTYVARNHLLSEGIPPSTIVTTGNTVVDALYSITSKVTDLPEEVSRAITNHNRVILVTAHRRESWGKPLADICAAINELVYLFNDVEVVFPIHKNPKVRDVVFNSIVEHKRIHIIEPLNYFDFISTMKHSSLVLSDSGGVQEEAPTFGVPVLVLRKTTERPEALTVNLSNIVGTNTEKIVKQASKILGDTQRAAQIAKSGNPFGDGRASKRIIKAILAWSNGKVPYLNEDESFVYAELETSDG
ncbi:non-hydrolyzing UDP-N-acetylglucosamine 2-epimerase [Halodesulfovibrio marinisediminis]|uniref:UDP-N-acetylglucosamine 2-epimerase (non-hydrolyzing) n=1 Tax=Halodesulfovibrio marinisediminis DSM 17456 TaxID=1121457 RepID=A0A1N6FQM7_9BACT|nr:UDP-N-acetylglucosamine 2-epimerase (non-hydrolyzing) [Halodesulfovibrio marinisediminis]SIN97560.1 UDP-N-acetylglucosamine 2-epimerase (non-hydrolysing) [Halodesulfovibrio marinisediminis DSM 17456]